MKPEIFKENVKNHKNGRNNLIAKAYKEGIKNIDNDILKAIQWASKQLEKLEGAGYTFEICAASDKELYCAIGRPEWDNFYNGKSMQLGSEAIIMATCQYIYGDNENACWEEEDYDE